MWSSCPSSIMLRFFFYLFMLYSLWQISPHQAHLNLSHLESAPSPTCWSRRYNPNGLYFRGLRICVIGFGTLRISWIWKHTHYRCIFVFNALQMPTIKLDYPPSLTPSLTPSPPCQSHAMTTYVNQNHQPRPQARVSRWGRWGNDLVTRGGTICFVFVYLTCFRRSDVPLVYSYVSLKQSQMVLLGQIFSLLQINGYFYLQKGSVESCFKPASSFLVLQQGFIQIRN